MINHDILTKADTKSPATWLATWFGFGLLKPAPGTWGTVGALPFGVALLYYGDWPVLAAAAVICFVIGLWASHKFDAMIGGHDCSAIVIDEAVGVWIALLPALLHGSALIAGIYIMLAFLLFRFFDILKPWPVGWADKKMPGAWGVMVDDVFAGVMAAIIITGVRVAGLG